MEALLEASECFLPYLYSAPLCQFMSMPRKAIWQKTQPRTLNLTSNIKSLWYCCWSSRISSFLKSYNFPFFYFLNPFFMLWKMFPLLSSSNNLAYSRALFTFLLACPLSHKGVGVSPHFSSSHFFSSHCSQIQPKHTHLAVFSTRDWLC